jgi:hypothetical protein
MAKAPKFPKDPPFREPKNKVPIQKGSWDLSQETYKNCTHAEAVSCRERELEGLRSGITLTMMTPKY